MDLTVTTDSRVSPGPAGAAAFVAAWCLATEPPASLLALALVALPAVAIRPILLHRVEA